MKLLKPLQYSLGGCCIAAAIASTALPSDYGLIAKSISAGCGLLYWKLTPNLFADIAELQHQKRKLKGELRSLTSQFKLTTRQLEELTQQKQADWEQREQALQAQVEAANTALAQQEQLLQQQIETANEELAADKEQFLVQSQQVIAAYESKIELLESELDEMRRLLAQYEAPALPEGSSFEFIIARHCMESLLHKKVICEFKGVSVDEAGYVVVRLRPEDGGQRAVEKWANHLHIELELAEAPKICTYRGAVQIWLKPQEMVHLPSIEPPHPTPNPTNPTPNPPNLRLVKPESTEKSLFEDYSDNSDEPFNNSTNPNFEFDHRLIEFVEPRTKLPPYGSIKQIERDWVGWLYCFREPRITSQKEIIFKVWGYKSGESSNFSAARARLHKILKDAGIKIKPRKRA